MIYNSDAEDNLLSCLIKYANNALVSIDGFSIKSGDFYSEQNQQLYYLITQYLEQNSKSPSIDLTAIKFLATNNHLKDIHDNIDVLSNINVCLSDIKLYAKSVKMCSLIRKCQSRANNLLSDLKKLDISTNYETLCSIYDSTIDDFSAILINNDTSSFKHIYETVGNLLNSLISGKQKVGLVCQNFPTWMAAIGGSLRKPSLNVISGSVKDGKSALCLAVANDIASQGLPTFYVDTELTTDYQACRLIATNTAVPLKRVEYATFINDPNEELLINSEISKNPSNLPLYHWQAAGKLLDDILMSIKHWIVSIVGKDGNGVTKDCLVVFDYLKVSVDREYATNLAEWQILGMVCTKLHDLAVHYNIPIVMAAQLNREGKIGASARIDHLCSNRTIVARKSKEEKMISELHGEYSNRKLYVPVSRFVEPHDESDYLNINMNSSNGIWKEGKWASELNINPPVKSKNVK